LTEAKTERGKLRDRLCFSVYSASIAINRLYKPILDPLGLTYPQYLVLGTLWESDRQTIGAIADRLALDSSTITPLVKRLELAGFVARQRSAQDERQVHVSLTAKGRDVQAHTERLQQVMSQKSGMRTEELVRLNEDVLRLLAALTA
jgi:DNA-binding MarR family transcriptional regulator